MPKLYETGAQCVGCKFFATGTTVNCFENGGTPSGNPATGFIYVYSCSGVLASKNSSGTETVYGAAGGSSLWVDGVDPFIVPCNSCSICVPCGCATSCFKTDVVCANTFRDGLFFSNVEFDASSTNFCASGNGKHCTSSGSGSILICNGTGKAATIELEDGKILKLYTIESPDIVFKDFGSSSTENCASFVALDINYTKVTEDEIYNVQITPTGNIGEFYVAKKNKEGFLVISERDGTFDWEITKIRKNTSGTRWNTIENPPGAIYTDHMNTYEKYGGEPWQNDLLETSQ
jgi:hypothetical protein